MRIFKYLVYYFIVFLLAIFLGFVGWSFLFMANLVTHFLWLGNSGEVGFLYNHKFLILPYVMLGSLILGYFFSNFMVVPKKGIDYAKEFEVNKKVNYQDVVKIYILALGPIFLGASVGPEAAVIGIFFMLSSFVNDVTISVEKKFNLSILPNDFKKFSQRLKNNKFYLLKILLLYSITAITLVFLNSLDRFPPFYVRLESVNVGFLEVVLLIPLLMLGYLFGIYYKKVEDLVERFMSQFKNGYMRILVTSFILSIFALLFPVLILSGEGTLHILVDDSIIYGGVALVLLACLKVLLTNICISGNLRGGHIFPVIFSSFFFGTGIGEVVGLDLNFSIMVVTVGMVLNVFKSWFGMFLLLALFFPVPILMVIFLVALIFRERDAADKGDKDL